MKDSLKKAKNGQKVPKTGMKQVKEDQKYWVNDPLNAQNRPYMANV